MRWIVRLLSAALVLIIVAFGAISLIPSQSVADLAARRLSEMTGRAVTITGASRPTFWPTLGVRTGPITVGNAEWSASGPMLEAEALSIDLDMRALIGGRVRVSGIGIDAPTLRLERHADGRANWTLRSGQSGADASVDAEADAAGGSARDVALDRLSLAAGTLIYTDAASGTDVTLDAVSLDIDVAAGGKVAIDASAARAGQEVEVTGTLGGGSADAGSLGGGSIERILTGEVGPATLRIVAGQARAAFDGRMGLSPLAAEGRIEADFGDLAEMAALAGIAAPSLPRGLGAERVTLAGTVTLGTDGSVYLRGGRLGLDDNSLAGDADLVPGEARPRLSAQVSAGDLDLSALGAEGDGQGGGDTAPSGWSTRPLDAGALALMDARVAFKAASVDTGMVRMGETEVLVTVDRGRAVFDLAQVEAYAGRLSGQFVVNARGGLSVGGDLAFSGFALQPMLTDLADYTRLTGTGDVRLAFLGVGRDLDTILKSLEGSGSVAFGSGALEGLDLAGMLRTLDTSYVGDGAETIFDSVSASFTLLGGVLSNEDLAIRAPLVTATGAGAVGVGARTLDYRIQPTALTGTDGTGGIRVPLVITGPWEAPSFRLDLETLAREQLEDEARALQERARIEAARLESEARERLAARAEEELGIVVEEGESFEDAARRRVSQSLADELGKALDMQSDGN